MKNKRLESWGLIIIGVTSLAFGIQCFLEPANIVAGGITGIGIVLNEITMSRFSIPTPLWLVNIAFNLPLIFLAWKIKGRSFMVKTIGTSLLFSVMLLLFQEISFYTQDTILSAVYGGGFMGLGLGLVIGQGSTTGGVDLIAFLMDRVWKGSSISVKILVMDALVIFWGMAVFGGSQGIYALVAVVVCEICTRNILEKGDHIPLVLVVSRNGNEENQVLEAELEEKFIVISKNKKMEQGNTILFACVSCGKDNQNAQNVVEKINGKCSCYAINLKKISKNR